MPFEIGHSELKAVRRFLSSLREEERESPILGALPAGGVPLRARIARARLRAALPGGMSQPNRCGPISPVASEIIP
jgi:hypothetical protein